jgi:hypothetical protein
MTPLATIRVVLAEQTDPGVITVLLDLLEAPGLRSKWHVPASTDTALLDRLAFGGHEAMITNPDGGSTDISADPEAWLHEAQIEIGRALEHRQNWELQIHTAMLGRRDGMSAVAEALDLVAGLVRADRLRSDNR